MTKSERNRGEKDAEGPDRAKSLVQRGAEKEDTKKEKRREGERKRQTTPREKRKENKRKNRRGEGRRNRRVGGSSRAGMGNFDPSERGEVPFERDARKEHTSELRNGTSEGTDRRCKCGD